MFGIKIITKKSYDVLNETLRNLTEHCRNLAKENEELRYENANLAETHEVLKKQIAALETLTKESTTSTTTARPRRRRKVAKKDETKTVTK